MNGPALNPFVPGRGVLPPYLAGREDEKRALMGILGYVQAGRGAPRDVVLCGPRGNGKTVLLRWFQQEVASLDARIDVLWRTPTDLPSVDALANSLVPPGRFKSMLPDSLSLSIGIGRLGWELGDNVATLAELLALRCRQRALVLLLDEAHMLDPTVGQALLNASQSVSAEAPFLLVLAGTPGLEPQLNAMSATFWDRAEQLGIGLLDRTEASAALTRPFESETPPVTFEDSALARVLDDSQCYPYFLQLFGAALWDAVAASGKTTIRNTLAAEAAATFDQGRSTYYHHRRHELERAGLFDIACAISRAFSGNEWLPQSEVDSVICAATSGPRPPASKPHSASDTINPVLRIRDSLAAFGYIWNPPGEHDRWRPGIPSLLAHLEAVAGLGAKASRHAFCDPPSPPCNIDGGQSIAGNTGRFSMRPVDIAT